MSKQHDIRRYARPERLRMGRLLRGKTQRELADETGIDQSLISKYENGRHVPENDLQTIAQVLQLPERFFYELLIIQAFDGADMAMFRRRQTTSARIQDQVLMEMNRISENIWALFESIDVQTHITVPIHEPEDGSCEEIEDIADRARLELRIAPGPLQSMTRLLESMRVVIVQRRLPPKVDALVSSYSNVSILLLDSDLLGGRQRFTLAHELGHLIMHNTLNFSYEDIESQADMFASAFLMPARDIRAKLRSLTMERLVALSAEWRVSAQALIRRAHDLELLTYRQYRYWNQQLSKSGFRMAEPIAIPKEKPTLLADLIRIHLDELHYTVEELAESLMIEPWEFRKDFLGEAPLRILTKGSKPILRLPAEEEV